MDVEKRLAALRKLMISKQIDAYIVPSSDPHGSEYVADAWQRRAFMSGFDGSAGTVAITRKEAGLWTDSRYFIQAAQQLETTSIELFRQGVAGVEDLPDWLRSRLDSPARVAVNAALFSVEAFEELQGELAKGGIELVGVEHDLVDLVWADDRPELPAEPVRSHPVELAGEPAQDKISRLRSKMEEVGADSCVLTVLDEIAWLLNLRGGDVSYNPVFVSYAVVSPRRIELFVDPKKLGEPEGEARRALPKDVMVRPYEDFERALAELQSMRVWLDPASASAWVGQRLEKAGAELIMRRSPLPRWKASKNGAELEALKKAHLEDGVAVTRFLMWLDELRSGNEPGLGTLTELSVVDRLEELRAERPGYLGPSFATIAAYGPHGAIVHYRVTPESCSVLRPEGLLLVDSGGQYRQGTTDVTRTIALGEPTEAEKETYTAVLKGHLSLSRALFPAGTNGYQLDVIARSPLWSRRLDYGHGTGHGVGAALCVHEGPFSVSLKQNLTPLEPGNVLSIEPGCYRKDEHGVRIENLVHVVAASPRRADVGPFFGFEPLTLCPYDRKLIVGEMMTTDEIEQVDSYHRRVSEALSAHLKSNEREWLTRATAPL
jgi:Xaa-Pro aminopeptidase